MSKKITAASITMMVSVGEYKAAYGAALRYKIAVREILDTKISDNSDRFYFIKEHGMVCRLLDLLKEKIDKIDRAEEIAKERADRERKKDLERRMKARWGTEYDNGCSEYHIDPDILAAAETFELRFDREFR